MMSTWSRVGYGVGMAIIVAAGLRYFVTYKDPSQGVVYIFAGCVILALAWLYNSNLQRKEEMLKEKKEREQAILKLSGVLDSVELNIKERLE